MRQRIDAGSWIVLGLVLVVLTTGSILVGAGASPPRGGPSISESILASGPGSAGAPTALPGAAPRSAASPPSVPAQAPSLPFPLSRAAPASASGPSSGSNPIPYSQAAEAIDAAVSGFQGASWSILAAGGFDLSHGLNYPVANITDGCAITWVGPSRANLYLSPTPSGAAVGISNGYLFILEKDATPTEELLALVDNGSATLEFEESASGRCGTSELETPVPADILDSPEIVTLAEAAAASTFLAEHPHAGLEWAVTGFEGTPEWFVAATSPCGAEIDVLLNAFDGGVEGSIAFGGCRYTISVTESGLPTGTEWAAVENGSSYDYTTNASIALTVENGTYNLTAEELGYTTTPGWKTVTITGSNVSESFAFTRLAGAYSVTFNATGLPAGTSWQVELYNLSEESLQNGTGSSLSFWATAGTYYYFVEAGSYKVSPSFGEVTVGSKAVWIDLSFSPNRLYTVSFLESGLPGDVVWLVSVTADSGTYITSSTSDNLTLTLPNETGTYTISSYSPAYRPATATGEFTVDGAPLSIAVEFVPAPGYYSVAFVASGLPTGSAFNVTIEGAAPVEVGANTIDVLLANGSYSYQVLPVYGYSPDPSTGTVTVAGAGSTVDIAFAPVSMYLVTFTETGLPAGTAWTVAYANVSSVSVTAELEFYASDGDPVFYASTSYRDYEATPDTGPLPVHGAPASQALVFGPPPALYLVLFSETGLPTATNWSVTLGTTTNSSTATTNSFQEANGTYSYAIGTVAGYAPTVGTGSVSVAGTPVSVLVRFRAVPTYSVTFRETGLPDGELWSATLNGLARSAINTTITFYEPNGSYAFSVAALPVYLPSPAAGTITVAGNAVHQPVSFAEEFEITFSETGLPLGTHWTVNLSGSARSAAAPTISFFAPNGTYAFTTNATGYRALPASGSVTVQGRLVVVAVFFAARGTAVYAVSFTETGLAAGTSWWVNYNGANLTSTLGTLAVLEPNGTYAFTTGAFGYTATPSAGLVVVAGAALGVPVDFATVGSGQYVVTLTETGLPVGTSWQVTLNGVVAAGVGSTITFAEPSGTYSFTVAPVSGYTASPRSGSVIVSGGPARSTIAFTAVPKSSGLFGLPGDDGWLIVVAVVVVVAAVGAAFALRRPRKPAPASSPPPVADGGPPTPPAPPGPS